MIRVVTFSTSLSTLKNILKNSISLSRAITSFIWIILRRFLEKWFVELAIGYWWNSTTPQRIKTFNKKIWIYWQQIIFLMESFFIKCLAVLGLVYHNPLLILDVTSNIIMLDLLHIRPSYSIKLCFRKTFTTVFVRSGSAQSWSDLCEYFFFVI